MIGYKLTIRRHELSTNRILMGFVLAVFMSISMFAPEALAQAAKDVQATNQALDAIPTYRGYKSVMVGMPMNEARSKLGKARDMSDTEDFFVYSDSESAQVLYDTDKTVKAIAVNFLGTNSGAPTPKDIFGSDVEAKPDGSVYKMVRYPKEGYWISYNRTAGGDPLITITVHKLPRTGN